MNRDKNNRLSNPGSPITIICDVEDSGADEQTVTEIVGLDVVRDIKQVLFELGAKQVCVRNTREILSDLANGVQLSGYIVNLGAGLADAYRFGQTPLLLEIARTPYSGPTPYCMLLCRDKHRTKAVLRDLSSLNAPVSMLVSGDIQMALMEIHDNLLPAIVKPNDLGNSVGISGKVARTTEELGINLEIAFKTSANCILVEKFIYGLEVTVLTGGNGNALNCYPLGLARSDGSLLPLNYIRSFSDKITPPKDTVWVPLSEIATAEITTQAVNAAKNAWHILGCRDLARFDFRLDEEGQLWFIEANAQPDISNEATYVRRLNKFDFKDDLGLARFYIMTFLDRVGALA